MKRIISLLAAGALCLALLASCDGNTDTTSSTASQNGSAWTSSTASGSDSEYPEPAEIERDGNAISVFDGETQTLDVTPPIAAEQNSLDTYETEAYWIDESTVLVTYTYAVEKAPNYYEDNALVRIYDLANPDTPVEVQLTESWPLIKPYDGGFTVVYRTRAETYDKTGALLHSAEIDGNGEWFDVSSDGNTVLYNTGDNSDVLVLCDIAAGSETQLASGLGRVSAGAIKPDGSAVAFVAGGKPYVRTVAEEENTEIAVEGLGSSVQVFWYGESVLVSDSFRGGQAAVSALYNPADGAVTTLDLGTDFANPYAQGRLIVADGKAYKIYAETATVFSFGDLKVFAYDETLMDATETDIAAGYYSHYSYDFSASGKMLLGENVADGTDIKNYLHIF